jgi:hypothetical protein
MIGQKQKDAIMAELEKRDENSRATINKLSEELYSISNLIANIEVQEDRIEELKEELEKAYSDASGFLIPF